MFTRLDIRINVHKIRIFSGLSQHFTFYSIEYFYYDSSACKKKKEKEKINPNLLRTVNRYLKYRNIRIRLLSV